MNRELSTPDSGEIDIPFDRVAKFMRQISHDVRNNLGSMDLQAAYVAEIVTDSEVAAELRKLRGMIASTAKSLQHISRSFQLPSPQLVTLSARILFEDFRERIMKQHPEEAQRIEWQIDLGEEIVAVDIELIFGAFLEFCRNALQFQDGKGNVRAQVRAVGDELVFEVAEKRQEVETPLEQWGRQPLLSTRRAGYGLGLFHARHVIAAHHGKIEFVHAAKDGELTTRVSLPLARD